MTTYRHHENVELCDDCKLEKPTVTFGLGTVRCDVCSQAFQEQLYAKRLAKDKADREALAAHQAEGCPDDGMTCPECCEHGDMDHGLCLDCGEDRTEDMMAAAYDRAKDSKKYGD